MKKFKILVLLVFITHTCILFAAPIKKGAIVYAPNFNLEKDRSQWSKLSNAKWVNEGVAGKTCLFINGGGMVQSTIDLAPYKKMTLLFRCLVKAEGVTKPSQPYLGVKYMLHYKTPTSELWKNEYNIYGTFDWKEIRFIIKVPYDVSVSNLSLGLQGSTGKVWFDSISVSVVNIPVPYNRLSKIEGRANTTSFRGVMSSGVFKKEDIKTLGNDWNVNLIRWQLTPNQNEAKAIKNDPVEYDQWLNKKLCDLDSALIICKQYGIKLVIDLHVPPGNRDSTGAMCMFYDKSINNHFIDIWKKIAKRYKNNPTIWGYDLINEPFETEFPPNGLDNTTTQLRASEAIRELDEKTSIIIETDRGGLGTFTPINISNVIYEVHMYSPHTFTHQGIYDEKSGIVYPGQIDGKFYDKNVLKEILKPVRDFQLMYNVPIFVGEFSAVRWAPGAAQYLNDCIDIFEEYGWNWTYHAFRESPVWSVEHENGVSKDIPKKAVQNTDRKKVLLNAFAKNKKL